MKWGKKRRRRQRRRIAIRQNKIFPFGFQACPKREEITTPGWFDTKGNEDAWVNDGGTPTEARLLADHLFRLDPIAKLLPILFSYLHQFHHQLQYDGGRGVKWHPCLEGALTSPGTCGILCVRPFPSGTLAWIEDSHVYLHTDLSQLPGGIGTSSQSPCTLFLMHPWVFGELFCLFVHVFTKYMSHIFIRTPFLERSSS